MIIVAPYHAGFRDLAQRQLDWIKELDPGFPYSFLFIRDSEAKPVVVPAGFKSREVVYPNDGINEWPFSPNMMMKKAATEVLYIDKEPFLWLEPDCVPVKAGWLDAIKTEYEASGKPFMGDDVNVNNVPRHMSGTGVYPANAKLMLGEGLLATGIAWDVACKDAIVPNAHFSELIGHAWKHEPIDSPSKLENLLGQHPKMVLFHSDKSGCMIEELRRQRRGGDDSGSNHFSGSAAAGWETTATATEVADRGGVGSNAGNIGAETTGTVVGQEDQPPAPSPLPEIEGFHISKDGQAWIGNAWKEVTPITCDIFIKTYPADYGWLQLCLESIGRYCTGFSHVIVVAPDDKAPVGTREQLIVRSDETPDGYLAQQIIKLYADMDSTADFILHVDSDTLFTKPTNPGDFLYYEPAEIGVAQKAIWYYTPYEKTQTPWQPITEKFMKAKVPFEFMRRAPQMIPRWLYPKLREWAYATHTIPLSQYIFNQPHRDFSEFNALGAYAYFYHRDKFHWVNTEEAPMPEPCARQFRSWDGLTVYREEIDRILPAVPVLAEPLDTIGTGSGVARESTNSKEWPDQGHKLDSRGGRQKPLKRRKRRRRMSKETKAKLRKLALAQWEKKKAAA